MAMSMTPTKRVLTEDAHSSFRASRSPYNGIISDDITARLQNIGSRVRKSNDTLLGVFSPQFRAAISQSSPSPSPRKRGRTESDSEREEEVTLGQSVAESEDAEMEMETTSDDEDITIITTVNLPSPSRPVKPLKKSARAQHTSVPPLVHTMPTNTQYSDLGRMHLDSENCVNKEWKDLFNEPF
ncbi:hypothetical protein EW145_g316 [Phellinidium pouzarii]|uniref:Uncharacterized protein n=1 Tax=Phellinidium pouzarii TaxID=167371 RepID=A0A4S4LJ02_9AGAM|nr:hypothetical protein EW145_g316 [Phellinidium pouzarii]